MTGEGASNGAFNDGKGPLAMRTIGEVAEAFGLKTHVLRYWEENVAQLRPLRRSGGRRLYRPEDVAIVAALDRMVNREGYTLKGACAALSGKGEGKPAPVATAAPSASIDKAALVAQLRGIRNRLASALTAA